MFLWRVNSLNNRKRGKLLCIKVYSAESNRLTKCPQRELLLQVLDLDTPRQSRPSVELAKQNFSNFDTKSSMSHSEHRKKSCTPKRDMIYRVQHTHTHIKLDCWTTVTNIPSCSITDQAGKVLHRQFKYHYKLAVPVQSAVNSRYTELK